MKESYAFENLVGTTLYSTKRNVRVTVFQHPKKNTWNVSQQKIMSRFAERKKLRFLSLGHTLNPHDHDKKVLIYQQIVSYPMRNLYHKDPKVLEYQAFKITGNR